MLQNSVSGQNRERASPSFMKPVVMFHLLQRSQHLTDLEDLVHLAVAREQRPERVKLRHDASHGPDVDG